MFMIQIDDANNGFGKIRIGDFEERFSISTDLAPEELVALWIDELEKIVESNADSVFLPTWMKNDVVERAWTFYRISETVHIQENLLMVAGNHKFGDDSYPDRKTVSEDGDPISEWHVGVEDLSAFLKTKTPYGING